MSWLAAFGAAAFVMLCARWGESNLRIRHGLPHPPSTARIERLGVSWKPVQISARDGIALHGWLLAPGARRGCVVMLHGIGEARADVADWAPMLLPQGYCLLTPDNRGMGESGGEVVTYGVREADDVRRWVEWLEAVEHPSDVFGLGESLGAEILLQSLSTGVRFAAIVGDSPFSEFRTTARDRLERRISRPAWLSRAAATTLVQAGILYGRMRYGVDLNEATAVDAVRRTKTPILLIHGANDIRTQPWHSRLLAAENPEFVKVWFVPGAGHVEAGEVAPDEYRRRVLGWFSDHARLTER
jgi:uncharacterized protein